MPVLISCAKGGLFAATLYVLDVGYGAAVHLHTAKGDFLFDTGSRETVSRVVEHLESQGVTKVDAVFLSHTHPDHMGGLTPLSREIPVHGVYWNGVAGQQPEILADLKSLQKLTQFLVFHATETIDLGENLTATTLGTSVSRDDQNESSLVVFVNHPQWTLLFPGDIGLKRQKELAEQELPKNIHWMIWPHHGDQLDAGFIDKLRELRYAAISVGPNPYGLPVIDIESLTKKHRTTVFRTDQDGTLHFQLNQTVRRVK